MSLPSVSIIMTPHNRTQLLRNTLDSIKRQNYPNLEIIIVEDRPSEASTELLARQHGAKYAARRSHQEGWMNPAVLLNNGIKKATGDILIIQNAECRYETETGIADLIAPVVMDPTVSTTALVQSLNDRGEFDEWYCHPEGRRAGWIANFCQAVRREVAVELHGFWEDYQGYAFEDDDWIFRLRHRGIKFEYTKVLVSHQWHKKYHYTGVEKANEQRFFKRRDRILAGEESVVANVGRDWGLL